MFSFWGRKVGLKLSRVFFPFRVIFKPCSVLSLLPAGLPETLTVKLLPHVIVLENFAAAGAGDSRTMVLELWKRETQSQT